MMRNGHTANSIKRTQREARSWINRAMDITQTKIVDLDLPNLHHLMEIVLRFMPMLGNLRAATTNRFESFHHFFKMFIKSVRHNVGGAPEIFAINRFATSHTLRFVLTGGRWGDKLQYQIGDGLAALMSKGVIGPDTQMTGDPNSDFATAAAGHDEPDSFANLDHPPSFEEDSVSETSNEALEEEEDISTSGSGSDVESCSDSGSECYSESKINHAEADSNDNIVSHRDAARSTHLDLATDEAKEERQGLNFFFIFKYFALLVGHSFNLPSWIKE